MPSSTRLLAAVEFAAIKHQKQRRKGGEDIPYINHTIQVANLLAKEGNITDTTLLMAAVLHDTIEDTHTTYKELVTNFGKEVADLVMEVTDDKSLTKKERKALQVLNASKKSDKAKLLKIADKTCNVRDIITMPPDWSVERKLAYLEWAKSIVDQMRGINEALDHKFDEWYHIGLTLLRE